MAEGNKAVIPSITGYPMLDTALRVGITSLAALVTGLVVGFLNAHGFNDPNLAVEVGTAVFAILIGAATVAWSFINTKATSLSVVQHIIEALSTGNVSDDVKAKAVKAPEISDDKITKAINNAEEIKART